MDVAPVAAALVNNSVKFQTFWLAKIAAYFVSMEGVSKLRDITFQRAKFFNIFVALPETTVVLNSDLVETRPLPDNPFD